ncbi:MAG: hypothetical protein IT577_23865 [Verrucomicrobiae bacterium]|nr:hypothetical protein [Verrucomicrobiae bacterium]
MTSFLDGPAKGQHLMLSRAPYFLRVVRDGEKWDALDQPGDTPRPGEAIFAYRMDGKPGACFMDFSGRGGGRRGAAFTVATYRAVADGPTDAEMRDGARWREWCLAHAPEAFRKE